MEDIRDSLFCEYAYVIDLDRDELLFFIGGQRKPKEGNPYGSQWQRHLDMKEEYYHLQAVRCISIPIYPHSKVGVCRERDGTGRREKRYLYI